MDGVKFEEFIKIDERDKDKWVAEKVHEKTKVTEEKAKVAVEEAIMAKDKAIYLVGQLA